MSAVLNLLRNPRVALVAQIWIGLVFLAAALGKISDPAAFAKQRSIISACCRAASRTRSRSMLPWIELIAALALPLRAQPALGRDRDRGAHGDVRGGGRRQLSRAVSGHRVRLLRHVGCEPCRRCQAAGEHCLAGAGGDREPRAGGAAARPCSRRSRSRQPSIAPRSNRHAISAARSAGGTRGCRAGTRNPDRCGPGRQPAVPSRNERA